MPGVSVVQSGDYSLQVDVGFLIDGFTLDDPVKGLLDSPDYVLDGTSTFADVTSGTIGVNVRRGRRDEGDQFSAGTMTFTLNDTLADGVFNPFDNDSPYYDSTVPGLAPMREVRLIRYDDNNLPEYLFVGNVVNYNYNFNLGQNDIVSVYCADAFFKLGNTQLAAQNPTKEMSDVRIGWLLDEIGYPSGAARDIDPDGVTELGGSGQYAIAEGTNVKQYLDQIQQAEQGRIYIDRSGVFVSEPRIGITLASSVATFSDNGTGGIRYQNLGISFQAEDVINRVTVQAGTAGSSQIADDTASQTKYFLKSLTLTGTLLDSNAQALDLANYLLAGEPEPRFTDVETTLPGIAAPADRDTVAIIDIGDVITIEKTILVGGTPTLRTEVLAVEGVEHSIDLLRGHTARFYTTPTIIAFELLLDDPVYGTLDGANVLG
jgi:hypothetical protein